MNIFLKICSCNLQFGLGEKNVSDSRESKSNVYQITITCKYYAQIFKNIMFGITEIV